MVTRLMTEKDLAYDSISQDWDKFISRYDENRRIEVLIDDFLGAQSIKGKKCMDAGCGLGNFSNAFLKYQPFNLCAFDISPNLVEKLSQKLPDVRCFVANILELSSILQGETFDVIVCSEVIEHTPDPKLATAELIKAVTPGGLLAISVPNQRWHWLLDLAQLTRIRTKYKGYENWVLPSELEKWLKEMGMEIIHKEGVHTLPFPLCPKTLLRAIDQKLRKTNYSFALNLAILARKI